MLLLRTRLFNAFCLGKHFLSTNRCEFSTFRDSCQSILLTADPIEKSNKIIELYNRQLNDENLNFTNSEDDVDYWKSVNFCFPDNVTFKTPKEITNFCKGTSIISRFSIML